MSIGMFWFILFVVAVVFGVGYWYKVMRMNRGEQLEKIDILEGWKSIVDGRIAEFKRTMTRNERWAVVVGLSIFEAVLIFVIIPALTGSMLRTQEVGKIGSLWWFLPWAWQALWWGVSVFVAYLIARGIYKLARNKKKCTEKGESKKGGD
jgi:hypothetical protein